MFLSDSLLRNEFYCSSAVGDYAGWDFSCDFRIPDSNVLFLMWFENLHQRESVTFILQYTLLHRVR